jgi:TM2 domain-containing membrane protein YozV
MAYCNQCGADVASGNTFCEECGAEITETGSVTEAEYGDKDKTIAIVLALFVGSFGAHKFYLGDIKKGAIYLVLFWTGIPFFLGLYDAYQYYTQDQKFGASNESSSISSSSSSEASTSTESGNSTPTTVPDDAVMLVEGVNGRVTLYEDRLEISREDIGAIHKLQHGFKGDKELPLTSITSVQLRKPSKVTRGYIQFGQTGYSESDDGLVDATSDENTVLFDTGSLAEFQELREKVRELSKQDVESSTGNMDDAMQKLRERYANGEISEEEYEKRREVLETD